MALLNIKQINNSVAAEGAVITFDGSVNRWSNTDNGALQLSAGTTAQQPSGATSGMIRYNTNTSVVEFFNGAVWVATGKQNLWETITGDTGSTTANTTTDALSIIGGANITTSISGDTITINTSAGTLPIVTTFIGLPSTPSTNDLVFYTPFNSVMIFDGTDWVSPKITQPLFGRRGNANASTYLRGIAAFQTGVRNGIAHGLLMPDVGGGSNYKIYGAVASNAENISGVLELHVNSAVVNPVFGSTGIGQVLTYTTQRFVDLTFATPAVINSGDVFQTFLRLTAGRWRDTNITVTYSLVAA